MLLPTRPQHSFSIAPFHKVLKPQRQPHAFAVETSLGGWFGLSAFVVETHKDEIALRQLIRQRAPKLGHLRVMQCSVV